MQHIITVTQLYCRLSLLTRPSHLWQDQVTSDKTKSPLKRPNHLWQDQVTSDKTKSPLTRQSHCWQDKVTTDKTKRLQTRQSDYWQDKTSLPTKTKSLLKSHRFPLERHETHKNPTSWKAFETRQSFLEIIADLHLVGISFEEAKISVTNNQHSIFTHALMECGSSGELLS